MNKKIIPYNLFSLLCGLVFLLTSWMWTYFLNLFIALPFGAAGFYFWITGRKLEQKSLVGTFAIVTLAIGSVISIVSLFFYK